MGSFLERIDIVYPFAGEAPFPVQILVNVGDRRRVWIDAGMPRVNRSKERSVRARQRHADTRLHDAIAFGHPADSFIVMRAVQRMRDRSHQQLRCIARQDRV